jgi:osmotically-inducible protein OsmY
VRAKLKLRGENKGNMKRETILALFACAALALVSAACGDNENANTNANANRNANANVNVNTNANVNVNANATSGTRNYNISREEYNKNANSYLSEVKNAGESIGQGVEDGWIHFKIRGALALVDDLRDSTINVDVDNNVVTLRGTVANADQKAKAEKAAHVDGVKKVNNKLEIKADTSTNKNAGNTNSNANKKG